MLRRLARRANGGHEAPRRAVRGSSGPLCRAWGSLLQGLPPNQTPWPARAHEVGAKPHRLVSTRTGSWAHGYKPLADFCNPH